MNDYDFEALNRELAELSTFPDESEQLEKQIAQAQLLKSGAHAQHYNTAGGAALGGLAGLIDTVRGQTNENRLMGRQADIRQFQQRARGDYGHALGPGQGVAPSAPPLLDAQDAQPMDGPDSRAMGPMSPGAAPMAQQSDPRTLIPLLLRRQQEKEAADYQMPNPLDFG